ncbi:MAG: YigZ family protein [Oscillospiraceae bacterium]|nr:YigZ family protein [Oscillospiraceae bacterium]
MVPPVFLRIAMGEFYFTTKEENQAEFVEKHSRFIGYCKPIKTEQEAIDFINEKRKKHYDATHNVYAYSLREGFIKRYSDDGEPQGTAGVPVLDVLNKNSVVDTVIVVTRYFGGIMLGAGGLVRAYSHGAKIALDASKILKMEKCFNCEIKLNYDRYGKIASLIPECEGIVDDTVFLENVVVKFHIPTDKLNFFNKKLADATNGQLETTVIEEKFYSF